MNCAEKLFLQFIHQTIEFRFGKSLAQERFKSKSDTEAPFLDLNLSITNGIVSSKIYDKRDDFNFEIVKDLGQS